MLMPSVNAACVLTCCVVCALEVHFLWLSGCVCVCVVYICIGVPSGPHLFQEDRCKTELLQSVRFSEFPSSTKVLDWERNMGSWVGEMTCDIEDITMKEREERWNLWWRKALLNGYTVCLVSWKELLSLSTVYSHWTLTVMQVHWP